MEIRSVGICVKPEQPQLADLIRALEKWLVERGIEVLPDPESGRSTEAEGLARGELAGRVDLVIVLGGDGTLLAVARAVGARDVPILGVNLGTLGFLAEIARDEIFPTLEEVLAGRFRIEERMRLDVNVERDGRSLGRYLALNDAVISNTALSRLVHLETRADGAEVTTYRADGLIVATPTGSTAYNLAAGGPILMPGFGAMTITPICAHTLTSRPLVVAQDQVVSISLPEQRNASNVVLTIDGLWGEPVGPGDRIDIREATHPFRVFGSSKGFFDILREKLHWGAQLD
jgi:NAD+ kinase